MSCSVCKKMVVPPSKGDLRKHLIDNHTKGALADLIIDCVY
jgi:hypothetical protein